MDHTEHTDRMHIFGLIKNCICMDQAQIMIQVGGCNL